MAADRRAPSVRGRQLAAELRRLRDAATLTGEETAARLGWSPSKVSRIETGQTAPSPADLRRYSTCTRSPARSAAAWSCWARAPVSAAGGTLTQTRSDRSTPH